MAMVNRNVVTKVVEANEVEFLSRAGWRVVETIQDTFVEPFTETVPFMAPGNNYPTNGNGTKGFLVTRTRFLMQQDGSQALREAQESLERSDAAARQLSERTIAAEQKTAQAEREVLTLKENLLRRDTNYTSLNGQYTEERRLRTKMENDIAKIRQAVGELKMKEILGS